MRDRFELARHGTNVRTEITAGLTTYMTMAYILCVQPVVLASAGMDPGAVLTATCLASALASLLMGLLANYPIALAPALGHNFFFALTVCGTMGITWQVGMGANLVAGLLFLVITLMNLQGVLIAAIPPSLRHGIAVGIGLYIALIGLQWSGLVVDHPASLVALGDLGSKPLLVSLAVLVVTMALQVYRVRGAILLGILCGVALAIPLGVARFHGLFSAPPSLAPTFFAFQLGPLLHSGDLWIVVFVLLFLDVFDTMGTLVGVAHQGGFLKDGRLPRARAAFSSDAVGTVGGVCLGTTTVTSYIESAAGIAAGGRTGLTAVTVAGLFLLSVFIYPLVRTVGEGFVMVDGRTIYPLTAPALIIVGSMMMKSAAEIAWDDPVEAFPAFLAMLMIPLTFSITEGIAFGFVACSLLVLLSGRVRRSHPLLHIVALLFLIRWLFL